MVENIIPFFNQVMKHKIGLYIQTKGYKNLDLSNPEFGNPGIGGTQFCFLELGFYLLKYYGHDYDISVFSEEPLNLPNCFNNILVCGMHQLINEVYNAHIDILILKTPMELSDYEVISKSNDTKVIVWSHNYFNSNIAKAITRCDKIALNVFVSKQMYDFYIDNDIINKSTYIYNIVPDVIGNCMRTVKPYTLTYMGCLDPVKGIVELLKIWLIVEKKCPSAQLYIIGGDLYDRKGEESGRHNIVDTRIGKIISKYILDKNGKPKPNIHFLGILGKEKYDVFLSSSVGIVNPSARTETFGLGIIEMASAKLPVVTKKWNGHPDTAIDGETALLGFSIKQMAYNIIKLFEDNVLNEKLGENAKVEVKRFASQVIISRWHKYLQSIINGSLVIEHYNISHPFWNNYKIIRYINSLLRLKLHLPFWPSVVACETQINNIIKKLR